MAKVIVPRHVKQVDTVGCGVACVASLAGVSYKRALETALELFAWSKCSRTQSGQLRDLLEAFGIKTLRGRAVRDWDALPLCSIVAINPRGNDWHWVVHHRLHGDPVVLDPRSSREARTDFGRMRLRSYIPILR